MVSLGKVMKYSLDFPALTLLVYHGRLALTSLLSFVTQQSPLSILHFNDWNICVRLGISSPTGHSLRYHRCSIWSIMYINSCGGELITLNLSLPDTELPSLWWFVLWRQKVWQWDTRTIQLTAMFMILFLFAVPQFLRKEREICSVKRRRVLIRKSSLRATSIFNLDMEWSHEANFRTGEHIGL